MSEMSGMSGTPDVNYTHIIQQLSSAVCNAVKTMIDKAPVDRTYKMVVLSKVSDTRYKVQYKRTSYTAKAYRTNISVGDYVMVTAPCGNWNDLFIH